MTTEIKIIVGLVVLLALAGALWGYGHVRYVAGQAAGKAEIQAAWEIDKAAIAKLAAEAQAEAQAIEDAAKMRNQETLNDLQHKIDASTAAGNALALRLRNALASASARSGAVCPAPGRPATAAASGAGGTDELTAALGATFAECARNADRLDALIKEISPQLP